METDDGEDVVLVVGVTTIIMVVMTEKRRMCGELSTFTVYVVGIFLLMEFGTEAESPIVQIVL